ncbi:MAG: hypothetical protein ACTSVY_05270 [Candidatus Helarchaeota archaeon]
MSSWSEDKKELFAKIMSWGIIAALLVIVIGAILFALDFGVSTSTGGGNIFGYFLLLWTISNGLFVMVLGAMITGLFALVLVFSLLLKSGQRFFLDLIFKIEEAAKPSYLKVKKPAKPATTSSPPSDSTTNT